jgi:Ca2+-binding RTX toxin-like protein
MTNKLTTIYSDEEALWLVGDSEALELALKFAEFNGLDDRILIAEGVYSGEFIYDSGAQENKKLIIEGGWSGDFVSRDFNKYETIINAGINLDANDVAYTNGVVADAEIEVSGLRITNGYDAGLYAIGGGLGITLHNGRIHIHDNIFYENNVDGVGGGALGISSQNSINNLTVNIENNQFLNNGATFTQATDALWGSGGGAIFAAYVNDLNINDNLFDNNYVEGGIGAGGAIKNYSGKFITIKENTFVENEADGNGGAIWLRSDRGGIEISNNEFISNSADNKGGALSLIVADAVESTQISGNSFFGNKSNDRGGAIQIDEIFSGELIISANEFIENSSRQNGGALSISSNTGTSFYILDNAFYQNSVINTIKDNSSNGGAAYLGASFYAEWNIINNNFIDNYAYGNGGALAVSGGGSGNELNLINNLFSANDASSVDNVVLLSDSDDINLNIINNIIPTVPHSFAFLNGAGSFDALPSDESNYYNDLNFENFYSATNRSYIQDRGISVSDYLADSWFASGPVSYSTAGLDLYGAPRVQGAGIDIGAVELEISPPERWTQSSIEFSPGATGTDGTILKHGAYADSILLITEDQWPWPDYGGAGGGQIVLLHPDGSLNKSIDVLAEFNESAHPWVSFGSLNDVVELSDGRVAILGGQLAILDLVDESVEVVQVGPGFGPNDLFGYKVIETNTSDGLLLVSTAALNFNSGYEVLVQKVDFQGNPDLAFGDSGAAHYTSGTNIQGFADASLDVQGNLWILSTQLSSGTYKGPPELIKVTPAGEVISLGTLTQYSDAVTIGVESYVSETGEAKTYAAYVTSSSGSATLGSDDTLTIEVARFNADGVLDQSFGFGGKVAVGNPQTTSFNSVVARDLIDVASNGDIALAYVINNGLIDVVRLTSQGVVSSIAQLPSVKNLDDGGRIPSWISLGSDGALAVGSYEWPDPFDFTTPRKIFIDQINFNESLIYGTEWEDDLVGNDGDDRIYGLGGYDTFYLTKGVDFIDGGEGYDRIDLRSLKQGITVDMSEGIAFGAEIGQTTFTNIERVHGGDGNDTLIGFDRVNSPFLIDPYVSEDSSFTGGGGDDYIEGRGDADFVWYGGSPDAIQVDLETGEVTGGEGNDTLVGIEWVRGSNFSDVLLGSSANNLIFDDALGDQGTPNYLVGGSDHIDGRGGIDYLLLWNEFTDDNTLGFEGVYVVMNEGYAIDSAGNRDTFINIENIVGTNMSDEVFDDDKDNVIVTALGSDKITLGRGLDFAVLGGDNDTVTLTADGVWGSRYSATHMSDASSVGTNERVSIAGKNRYEDVIWGEDGYDKVLLSDEADVLVVEDRYSGYNTQALVNSTGTALNTHAARVSGFEEVFAGGGDDVIDFTSVAYASVVSNGIKIYGEAGNDVLWASHGNDVLDGGDGDDILNGGVGDDTLTGGTGADIYEFTATSGHDIITDFDAANDVIHIYARKTDTKEVTMTGDTITWGDVEIQLSNVVTGDALKFGDNIFWMTV